MPDDEIPSIMLGKRKFSVPELTWRDVKRLMPMMAKIARTDFREASEEQYNELADLVHIAVGRDIAGVKGITREDLDALPMTLKEILAAVPVIARQAGMESEQGAKDVPAGEALAESTSA
jgi:hypothetical protein